LIIFAKAPEPGQVKTRLSPPLTSDQAARLHEVFMLDVVRAAQSLSGVTQWLSCTPSTTHPFFRRLSHRFRLRLLTQTGETLGERMASALRQTLDTGATRVVLIGTDIPTLPGTVIRDAFRLLRRADVVLGSRYARPYTERTSALRLAQRLLAACLSALTRGRVTDATSGFCAVGPRAVRVLAEHHPTGYPEPELRLFLSRNALSVVEVPVRARFRLGGTTSLTAGRAAAACARVMLAIIIVPFRGKIEPAGD